MKAAGKKLAIVFVDISIAALLLLGIYIINYTIPQKGIKAAASSVLVDDTENNTGNEQVTQGSVVVKPSQVTSDGLVTTTVRRDAADCFQSAFAKDTYGNGYSEKLTDMSIRLGSVLAVNGDSYNNNRHQDNGTIIRNGVIYRSRKTDMETCVLNWDGSMQIYSPEELNTQTLIDQGAYQSWIFGPSLLDENGKAKKDFLTWDYIRESHPRTAIGYYEPGHYCLLVVDGREPNYSRGMFLQEEAAIFEQLGCKLAYNLDGGHCSFMTLHNQVISHPYKAEHEVPDGIFIMG